MVCCITLHNCSLCISLKRNSFVGKHCNVRTWVAPICHVLHAVRTASWLHQSSYDLHPRNLLKPAWSKDLYWQAGVIVYVECTHHHLSRAHASYLTVTEIHGEQHHPCESVTQGFGNVGAWAAEMLHVRGGRVLCVSDRDGAIHNEQGLDIHALRRHVAAAPPFGGSLLSFPGGLCALSFPSSYTVFLLFLRQLCTYDAYLDHHMLTASYYGCCF